MMESQLGSREDENYVEYRIFPAFGVDDDEPQAVGDFLATLLSEILAEVGSSVIDFIWQKDPFGLRCALPTTEGEDTGYPPHIRGLTRFGDNIEDEWFIVYLVSLITKKFPGCVASIRDNDGELLLIEAANFLPRWLDPDTSTNRVFLYGGELHIVPYPATPGELPILPIGVPMVQHSLTAIQTCPHVTRASDRVRNVIESRIAGFANNIEANFHHAVCSVPVQLAALLKEEPQLVSAAVEAFYQRDPIDLKACRTMKHFPPDEIVTTKVKLSRIMYAQLMHQRFQPDRRSGWRLPPTSNPKYKSADLGMKIAHGFEIIASRAPEQTFEENGCHGDEKNAAGVRWERFLAALKAKGYFEGELEGSKRYRDLYSSAEKYFAESSQLTPTSNGNGHPGNKVLRLLKNMTFDPKTFKEAEHQLPDATDDSWLTITPEQLNTILENASRQEANVVDKAASPSSRESVEGGQDANAESTFDPELITNSFKSFVDTISGYQGAEFPRGRPSVPSSSVNLDPEKFSGAIEDILRCRSDEDEASSGSLSDHFFEEDLEDGSDEAWDNEAEDETIQQLMEEMDRQLCRTEVGKSFERAEDEQAEGTAVNEREETDAISQEDDDADYRPVELDVNLLKNILESYSSQQGLAGPASNLLHSMGVMLPPNADQ